MIKTHITKINYKCIIIKLIIFFLLLSVIIVIIITIICDKLCITSTYILYVDIIYKDVINN